MFDTCIKGGNSSGGIEFSSRFSLKFAPSKLTEVMTKTMATFSSSLRQLLISLQPTFNQISLCKRYLAVNASSINGCRQ